MRLNFMERRFSRSIGSSFFELPAFRQTYFCNVLLANVRAFILAVTEQKRLKVEHSALFAGLLPDLLMENNFPILPPSPVPVPGFSNPKLSDARLLGPHFAPDLCHGLCSGEGD